MVSATYPFPGDVHPDALRLIEMQAIAEMFMALYAEAKVSLISEFTGSINKDTRPFIAGLDTIAALHHLQLVPLPECMSPDRMEEDE